MEGYMVLSRVTETLMLGTKPSKISISGKHANMKQYENKGKELLSQTDLGLDPN